MDSTLGTRGETQTRGLIISVTGHRPEKVGGYRGHGKLTLFAEKVLDAVGPDLVITGMALGWDQAVAWACLELGISFHAYIPFIGQEHRWPGEAQTAYRNLLLVAEETVVVSPGPYEAWKMHKRNEAMVNAADEVVALWNGTSGGTEACVKYAEKTSTPVLNVWDEWKKFDQSASSTIARSSI